MWPGRCRSTTCGGDRPDTAIARTWQLSTRKLDQKHNPNVHRFNNVCEDFSGPGASSSLPARFQLHLSWQPIISPVIYRACWTESRSPTLPTRSIGIPESQRSPTSLDRRTRPQRVPRRRHRAETDASRRRQSPDICVKYGCKPGSGMPQLDRLRIASHRSRLTGRQQEASFDHLQIMA